MCGLKAGREWSERPLGNGGIHGQAFVFQIASLESIRDSFNDAHGFHCLRGLHGSSWIQGFPMEIQLFLLNSMDASTYVDIHKFL